MTFETTAQDGNASKGIIHVDLLWQTNRGRALDIFADAYGKYEGNYTAAEIGEYNLEHFTKKGGRFDRQNNVNGGGKETSVWTGATVRLNARGKVVEVRVTELYSHGTVLIAYEWSATGKISPALTAANLAHVLSPNNKRNAQGELTSYQGRTWQDVVTSGFLGVAMEQRPGKPAPAGLVIVLVTHTQPPMEEGGVHTRLDLYWAPRDGSQVLSRQDYRDILRFVRVYNLTLALDLLDPEAAAAFVDADEHYNNEISQLAELIGD